MPGSEAKTAKRRPAVFSLCLCRSGSVAIWAAVLVALLRKVFLKWQKSEFVTPAKDHPPALSAKSRTSDHIRQRVHRDRASFPVHGFPVLR